MCRANSRWRGSRVRPAGGAAVKRRVFAPHLPKNVLELAARGDRMLRGDKARLTADRVSYMTHPNWVARSDRKVPRAVWEPVIPGEEGLRETADWYRREGWLR